MFPLDKIVHLRSTVVKKGSWIKQIEQDTYFNRYAEASKSLQNSKIASLKTVLQKANEKLKTQEVSKPDDSKTDMTLTDPFPLISLSSHGLVILSLNCPSTLKTMRQLPFKIKTTWGRRPSSSDISHWLVKGWTMCS